MSSVPSASQCYACVLDKVVSWLCFLPCWFLANNGNVAHQLWLLTMPLAVIILKSSKSSRKPLWPTPRNEGCNEPHVRREATKSQEVIQQRMCYNKLREMAGDQAKPYIVTKTGVPQPPGHGLVLVWGRWRNLENSHVSGGWGKSGGKTVSSRGDMLSFKYQ